MKLYEFQGKEIFKKYNIPIQSGFLINENDEVKNLTSPLVLKSQVLTGGRGKAGGIKLWEGDTDVSQIINELFSLNIKGEKVRAILALEKVDILREIYISITFNRGKSTPVLIVGTSGGMDIEKSAQSDKDNIHFIEFDPFIGILDYQIRLIAKKVHLKDVSGFRKIIKAMYQIFKDYDAVLIEINPLAVTPLGLMAIDSKVDLDDKASFRHQVLFQELEEEQESLKDKEDSIDSESTDDTITFVPLSGDIGVISDGAGTGLLALDIISDFDGKVASFCELGGITNSEIMLKALRLVNNQSSLKSILVVLIGGFNRMDHMAEGIIQFKKELKEDIPIFIRMCGTKEEVGKQLMKDENMPVYNSLIDAAEAAVKEARGN